MIAVCPACQQLNRIKPVAEGRMPVCAACQAPLLPAEPVALAGEALRRTLGRHEQPVVIDYWAAWCGPCRAMAPEFAKAAAARPDLRFVKLDTEAEPAFAGEQGIRSIPTLAVWSGGREIARRSGAMPASELLGWLAGVCPTEGSKR
jgi:thioredoxin 2